MKKKLKKTCFIKNNDELVNKKWLFQLLCCFKDEKPHRFKHLLEMLEGISTKTLSQRLRELVSENILEKKQFKQIPPKTEYYLTKKGYELLVALEPFEKWSEKWMAKKIKGNVKSTDLKLKTSQVQSNNKKNNKTCLF